MKTIIPLLSLLSLCTLVSCGPEKPPEEKKAMAVKVAKPISKMYKPTDIYTGRFVPIEEVDLRPRVSGVIDSLHFEEGKQVEKGDLICRIDPRLFEARVASANAGLAQAESKLRLAQSSLKRAEKLIKKNAIAQEEFDIRDSEVTQAEADVLAAKATLRTADLDREFADVRAPISGIAGKKEVTPGNYVTGGSSEGTILTKIIPHSPIHCVFEVDERRVLQFTRMYFKGDVGGREGESPPVEIAVSDSDKFEFEGKIDFSENELTPGTATLQIRAIVENKDEFLTPGLFARVRSPVGEPSEKLFVREAALGFDLSKRFAWVLKDDNTVERRYVETGNLVDDLRIIESGLTADDKVAVSGIQLLRPGVPLDPSEIPMVEEKSEQ